MNFRRLSSFGVVALLVVAALAWRVRPRSRPATAPSPAANFAATAANEESRRAAAEAADDARLVRRDTLARLAYAQGWDAPQSPALIAFHDWAERYRRAPAPAARLMLEAEGVALARARRPVMLQLIQRDPAHALTATVPAVVRQNLPPTVLAELETRVAGRGDFMLLETTSPNDDLAQRTASRRVAVVNGVSYTAHPYGRREPILAKEGASLHGIALDGHLALHESPLRVLEPGELTTGATEDHCPVSSLAVTSLPAGTGANLTSLDVVEADGRIWEFCGGEAMLENFERRLTAAEEQPGPRVRTEASGASNTGTPASAADAPTSRTIGTQRVLVIRVDFSDFPGEPVTAAVAQDMMDGNVRLFLESASYGATTITTTVSGTVYRMPQTGSAYALAGSDTQLHSDARAAAAANFTLASFDRIIVVFPNLGTSKVPGSKITFGGEAIVGGSSVWINGGFPFRILTHELGHTYGLKHANLWQVNDNNAVSNVGGSAEYKDPFDAMGDSSSADSRFHYSHWAKNRLGWLPDAAVKTITTSGTYRVYRFDHQDVRPSQTQALRVFRDGVRWYWIGFRQNFTANASLTNGAYIVWGTNSLQQTQLLDLTTPGNSSTDAALAVGATFTDPTYGITIRPIARGGTDPELWLDVEVTVPAFSPGAVVSAWGREGVPFFDSAGLLTAPVPETYVPQGLTNVQAIAAGDSHAIALKTDGTVVVWGNDLQGQTGIPIGLANVVAVAAAANVCGALKRDGTISVWGDTTTGQRTIPAGLADVRQLALGTNHALVVKNDGTVVAWGGNASGQTTVPAGLSDVVSVAAGNASSIALKRDGTVVAWGASFTRTPPAGLNNVVAISSFGASNGGQFAVALKADGTVVPWGASGSNQLTVPDGLNNVVAIATGAFHSLATKADGTIVAWGSTTSGKLNVPRDLPRSFALAASASASFALTGAHVYFAAQPQNQSIAAGTNATLSVNAVGGGALAYQWRKNGVAIPGATGATLTLANVALDAAARYDVVVSDATSSLTTFPAQLTVTPAAPLPGAEISRISNLSIRTNAGTGAQTLIVGYVVGGSGTTGTKPLLIRGVGPTLAAFGVPGALADPKLELYTGTTKSDENDNWGGTAALSSAFTAVGAFQFSAPASKDSALFNAATNPGTYTAQVSGIGGTTGVALAEIYDSSPTGASFTSTVPRLINVSARTASGTGAEILIAGFVIAGPTAKTVLIRAIGPTLGLFGVTGVLADPQLALYSGTTKINENDNWGGSAALSAAFASVGAFPLATTTKDAALLVTLAPGTYTAQVSGVGGTTGVALVEIYDVP